MIPFIKLEKSKNFEKKILSDFKLILKKKNFLDYSITEKLENKINKKIKTKFCSLCGNGTDALQLALRCSGVGKNDKVLVQDFTFWGTLESIINVGAIPYLIDVEKYTHTVSLSKLRTAIDDIKPKAIIIVHLFGWGDPELDKIRLMCKKKKVVLIEDGAQAFGSKYKGKDLSSESELFTYSFYPSKIFGSCGDSGAVMTNKRQNYLNLNSLRDHGRSSRYYHNVCGWNSRIDSFRSIYLIRYLDEVFKDITKRNKKNFIYKNNLEKYSDKIISVNTPENYIPNGYLNVNYIPDDKLKKKIERRLKEKKIGFSNIYPKPLSFQNGIKYYLKNSNQLKYTGINSKWISDHIINLPLYASLSTNQIRYITSIIKNEI